MQLSSASCAICIFWLTTISFGQELANWDQWRGPNFTGATTMGKPPIRWSSEENVRWKVELPGLGSSSPIVHGAQVIVLTAVKTDRIVEATAEAEPVESPAENSGPDDFRRRSRRASRPPTNIYKFYVLSFDRSTGKKLWETEVAEALPHEAGHTTNTFAASSPVTDGQQIYVNFGSRGVYCLRMDGQIVWKRDFGKMRTASSFGEGASATLAGDKLIVPWDHEGDSMLIALSIKDGSEIWKQSRDESTTWSTPLFVEHNGVKQIITNGRKIRSYDADSGQLLWECGGQTANPIPSPIPFGSQVICMTGYRGFSVKSISLDSRGEITDKTTWSRNDSAPYVPTATLYEGKLYLTKGNNGIVSCIDATTGQELMAPTRLEQISIMYSSPVAAAGHVYFTGRDGQTVVIEHGDSLKVVATNDLDETVDSSLAIVGDTIFIRGQSHLYCIAER